MLRRMATETVDIVASLNNIRQLMKNACATRKQGFKEPLLIAVSKTKPVEMIVEAYQAGQKDFGENYVQELIQKASDEQILSKCPDIRWHFIGHLQRNKVTKLIGAPSLTVVDTVDSVKLADALNSGWEKRQLDRKLDVMLEINTSKEPNKHGIHPDQVVSIADHINARCPGLKLKGLMTIGAIEHSTNIRPNPDFVSLFACHQALCEHLRVDPSELELSMGMSEDFEHAIEMGSSQVRVGSKIFGSRVYHTITDSGDEKE
ncbi:pyridoxal phosphate homeostasis protein-like [Paramacrobiotus metropolitanus]|uniref:pyridoxal phosphate homeostasis protein-like n=1 Tax=Paramacrobiotus metropolitanus TaxID=2943436 RepID=UPI002445689E|nr:pyridoxal phosphate homeostasis protein-like [Paramacrobiotus metropolitanus]XP_055350600.1 pyridoxal phosphate homeostasis protein-like [Paramacrobiotus metropolitanus]